MTKWKMKNEKNKNSMLAYCKAVLVKMTFNKMLFKKEYYKSLRLLSPEEHMHFRSWVLKTFGMKMFLTEG